MVNRFAAPLAGRQTAWGAAGVVAAAAALALSAWWGLSTRSVDAQEVGMPPTAGITVIGDGVVTAPPSVTTVRLGVQVTAPTPAEALAQTRTESERVLQRLRGLGTAAADIQTSGLNVFPIQAPSPGGSLDPRVISGYRGTSTVTVQVQDVSRAGAILDAAVQAGATSVQGLSFGLRDDSELRRRAIAQAIAEARPKAEAAATAAGLTLSGIQSVVELPFDPPRPLIGAGGGAGGFAPGELRVAVRVQVTYNVSR